MPAFMAAGREVFGYYSGSAGGTFMGDIVLYSNVGTVVGTTYIATNERLVIDSANVSTNVASTAFIFADESGIAAPGGTADAAETVLRVWLPANTPFQRMFSSPWLSGFVCPPNIGVKLGLSTTGTAHAQILGQLVK